MEFSIWSNEWKIHFIIFSSLPYILPSLHWLPTSHVDVGQHVDVVSQLRQGGQDEDHRGEGHHAHRGESVELFMFICLFVIDETQLTLASSEVSGYSVRFQQYFRILPSLVSPKFSSFSFLRNFFSVSI